MTTTTYLFTATVTDPASGDNQQWTQPFTVSGSGGGGMLVGATLDNLAPFPPNTTQIQASNQFDTVVSSSSYGGTAATRTPCYNVQKFYGQEGDWPASIPSNQTAMGNAGCRLLVSLKPSRAALAAGGSSLTAEQNNLQNAVQMYITAGYDFEIVLWQEPLSKDGGVSPFASGAAFVTYWNAYAPVITGLGATCIWDINGSASPSTQTSYYPGDTYVDKLYVDYYCPSWKNGLFLANVASLATTGNLPVGLGEIGLAVSSPGPDQSDFANYCSYITTFFQTRNAAGLPNGDVVWYNAQNPGGVNELAPTPYYPTGTPSMLGAYQGIYDALNGL